MGGGRLGRGLAPVRNGVAVVTLHDSHVGLQGGGSEQWKVEGVDEDGGSTREGCGGLPVKSERLGGDQS